MLIKEYRIPLPLTVEEYRIAQLYMIAKKSSQESKVWLSQLTLHSPALIVFYSSGGGLGQRGGDPGQWALHWRPRGGGSELWTVHTQGDQADINHTRANYITGGEIKVLYWHWPSVLVINENGKACCWYRTKPRGRSWYRFNMKIHFKVFSVQVYHIGSHLPGWFKSLLPASALTVEERAWLVASGKLKIFSVQLFQECLSVHQDSF